jgi:hypothetical protein
MQQENTGGFEKSLKTLAYQSEEDDFNLEDHITLGSENDNEDGKLIILEDSDYIRTEKAAITTAEDHGCYRNNITEANICFLTSSD